MSAIAEFLLQLHRERDALENALLLDQASPLADDDGPEDYGARSPSRVELLLERQCPRDGNGDLDRLRLLLRLEAAAAGCLDTVDRLLTRVYESHRLLAAGALDAGDDAGGYDEARQEHLVAVADLAAVVPVVEAATVSNSATPSTTAIVSRGNRCYQIGDQRPVIVGHHADDILQAFLRQPAMDGTQLVEISGHEDAVKMLKNLAAWYDGMFAPAIHLPGRKGAGGYHVAIRKA